MIDGDSSAATDLAAALTQLHDETLAGFAWLAEGLDRDEPVSFVPNPGNIGDAAINLACWRFLVGRFGRVEMCASGVPPSHRIVFLGGGGNLVEPLYRDIADILEVLPANRLVRIFPATVYGYDDRLRRVGARLRVVCREAISHRFVQSVAPEAAVRLGHDAALALFPQLQGYVAAKAAFRAGGEARLYRTDHESATAETGGLDVMAQQYSGWRDMDAAARWVELVARYLLGFSRIVTDRLHGAILSAMLGRETVLLANSYFKNSAVFEYSLARLPHVRFDGSRQVAGTPRNDPVMFRETSDERSMAPGP